MVGALALLLFAGCAPASGSVWAGSRPDKQDQQESLDGPAAPDIKRVTVRHDRTIGRVAVRVTYWAPFDPEGGEAVDHWLDWRVFDCDHPAAQGAPWGMDDTVIVDGYDGDLQAKHAWSPDHTVVTYRIENEVFQGRRFNCFTVSLMREDYSSASSPYSRYNDECGCWTSTWTPEDIFGRLKRRA